MTKSCGEDFQMMEKKNIGRWATFLDIRESFDP